MPKTKKPQKKSSQKGAFNWKNSLLVGVLLYTSTVTISSLYMLAMNLITNKLFNANWFLETDPVSRAMTFQSTYATGFYIGISTVIAAIMFIFISFLEEKSLLKNLVSIKNTILDGLVFVAIFFLGEQLLSTVFIKTAQSGDSSIGFGVSIQSSLPYTEIFWAIVAFVAILPTILFFFRSKKI